MRPHLLVGDACRREQRLSEHGDARDSRRRLGRVVRSPRSPPAFARKSPSFDAPFERNAHPSRNRSEVGILVADGVLRAITEEKIVRRHVDAGEPPAPKWRRIDNAEVSATARSPA